VPSRTGGVVGFLPGRSMGVHGDPDADRIAAARTNGAARNPLCGVGTEQARVPENRLVEAVAMNEFLPCIARSFEEKFSSDTGRVQDPKRVRLATEAV